MKLQEERKEEITFQIQSGEKIVDQSLSEEKYGDKTSGTIAQTAEEDSFVFLPNRSAYSNSIAEYDYSEGLIYEVVTSPGSVTDIRLQPGGTADKILDFFLRRKRVLAKYTKEEKQKAIDFYIRCCN